jgi:rubrerythrin
METTFPKGVYDLARLAAAALALERETGARYAELTAIMRRRGHSEVAGIFEQLADAAARHQSELEDWTRRLAAPRRVAVSLDWQWTALEGAAGEELDPKVVAPYQALAAAVRNEENAFRFYSHVAANAQSEAVQARAEALAKEELAHAALLRRGRRRAYRSERRSPEPMQLPEPALVETLADLLFAARAIEREMAEGLAAAAQRHPDLQPSYEETRRNAEALEEAGLDAGRPRRALVQSFQQHTAALEHAEQGRATLPGSAERALADGKRAFAFYDGVVAAATEESVMLKAQALSEVALSRITALARYLGERLS